MKNKYFLLIGLSLTMLSLTGCSQTKKTVIKPDSETSSQVIHSKRNAGLVVTKNNKTNSNTDSNSEDDNQDQQSSSTVTLTHKQSNDDSTDNDAETTQKIPGKVLGTLVCLLKTPDWFKDGIKGGAMYYAKSTPAIASKDYSVVTSNGDPTGWICFKQVGSQVIVKYVDASHSKSVAEAPVRTEQFAISRLLNDYYVTQDQKDEVNGYANALKPLPDYK